MNDTLAHQLHTGFDPEWRRFAEEFLSAPVVARIVAQRCSIEDYRCLLRDLRAQVVDGARWLARAAGSLGPEQLALRGALLRHAVTEHQDFRMLEADYVAVGGAPEDMVAPRRNVGTEALCAWMEELSGRRGSLGILGALMIFEGVGSRLAPRLGKALQGGLGLREDQCRFITYHAEHDAGHQGGLREVLRGALRDADDVHEILRSARITGMLYAQQYRCLGEY